MREPAGPYVLSLDVGTSSVRAALYDVRGEPVPDTASGRPQHVRLTADGGAEMRAEEVLRRSLWCVEDALARAGPAARRIVGVAVSTYWHSILGVGADGMPRTPVYLWSDTRSVAEVEELRGRLDATALHLRTGCPLHTSYVAPKLLWVARTHPQRLRQCRRWLSIGEYLFLRLFGEPRCSLSMASGTGMFNLAERRWDEELLAVLPISVDQLSKPVDREGACSGLRPEFASRLAPLQRVPWFPALGDGACSNVGSGAVTPDRMAAMVGTSGAMRVLFRSGRPDPPEGLWAYLLDGERSLLGGALSNGGNWVSWLVKTLRAGPREHLDEQVASLPPDGHGLTILPFLMGERSPGWRGDARAAIVGLSAHTRPADIVRAGLEAVAYRFALIHERLVARLGTKASGSRRIVATGGALLRSPAWMQILADVLNEPVVASREPQASARGTTLVALETLGLLESIGAAEFRFGETYQPDPARHVRYCEARARQADVYRRLLE